MNAITRTFVTLVAAGVLAACGSAPATHPTAPQTGPVPTASPTTPSETTPKMLVFNQTWTAPGQVSVTVLDYKQPVSTGYAIAPPAGQVWGAARVKVCALTTGIMTNVDPWTVVYADGAQYKPAYIPDVLPAYPLYDTAIPNGRCATGWIQIGVPAGVKPAMVEYRPSSGDIVDWTVPNPK